MNILDLIMLLGLVIGVLIGFVRGLVQQAMGLITIYISMVVGVWAHRVFGNLFLSLFPALTRGAADILGFTTVVIILLNVLSFVVRDLEKNATWVRKVPALINQSGGLILGFVTTAFWLGLAGTALVIVSQALWVDTEGASQIFLNIVNRSIMVYVFRYAFWFALFTVYPWIPGGLPEVFSQPL